MEQPWLANKRIVIMGGTTGIGLSALRAFLAAGARVIAIGLDSKSVEQVSFTNDDNLVAEVGDATQPGIAAKAIRTCVKKFGGFEGLYHVAGGSGRRHGDGPLDEMTLEGWNQTMAMNLTSLMLSNQAAVKAFLGNNQGGSILNIGSVLGYSPSPKYFSTHAYAAAKSAVIGFSKSIASFYAPNNIRVNVIAPGLVDTPMAQRAANDEGILKFIKTKQPLDNGRIGQPTDLDGAAVYFMSDHSRFTTGQVLSIDGGWGITDGQF